ncbi:cytochrome P450 monooxygenase 5 [Heterobasidion irregulare TC 32-1]|uniref:Cytochrome P450 monooxygenase 5 n=1 Tax=Heterobasidion irregulare (strain TC 32-1) TaxID=747525 RepID=W4JQ19_HETIT|nr:cytochrome P450 monooxygenase 5 [Heterobasidion irregulare TC 32-1]ETW75662.1 cytochrome P450 monooxygenase 5 [Heterobasidion irregulare TC 32-1]
MSFSTILRLVLLCLPVVLWYSRRQRTLTIPPGPQGGFFSGVASVLSKTEPWRQYASWSKRYGDVISFRVYNQHIVVLNTYSAVHDLLDKRAAIYSDRPKSWMLHHLVGREKTVFNIAASDARHRRYRKILHNELNQRATERYAEILEDETTLLIQGLEQSPQGLEDHVRRHAGSVIMKLAFGYSVAEHDDFFVQAAEESSKISGFALAPGRWLVESYPLLRFVPLWFPGAGFKRQADVWRRRLDVLTDVPHQWVKTQMASGNFIESFTSRLLRDSAGSPVSNEDEDIVKWCAAGLYAGAADTTVSALLSFVMLMALHPNVQRRAQEEIDSSVGHGQPPTLADTRHLEYLTCVMKEVLRFAPVGPLGSLNCVDPCQSALAHKVSRNDEYRGYLIPKDATVFANVWSILHDAQMYPNPFAFDPGRFYPSDVPGEAKTQPDPRELAFGFGRRVCPGSFFAEASMLVAMGNLLFHFDIVAKRDGGAPSAQEVEFTTGITSHIKLFDVDFLPRETLGSRGESRSHPR